MNIRSKITLIFTLLTGSLLTVAFVVIYIFSDRYTKNEFYQRLNERASIIGEAHFEEDEVSAQVYEEVLKRYQQILPSEKELIFRVDTLNKEITENIEIHFPDEFIINIFEKRKASIANEGTYSR